MRRLRGPRGHRPQATTELIEEQERILGPGILDAILDHDDPFLPET